MVWQKKHKKTIRKFLIPRSIITANTSAQNMQTQTKKKTIIRPNK